MKVLLTGAAGMLGRTLQRRFAGTHDVVATDRDELDITDQTACNTMLAAHRPATVVHCAAHTAVDRCETEVELAFRLNELGSANVARACQAHGARLIAISTDYVFRGDLDRPYHEGDAPDPATVYGRSKLAGERAVQANCADHTIVRIAWLYGSGGPSFLHTMLKLASQAGPPLRVVDDQVGNPTSTDAVADLLLRLLDRPVGGIVHGTCEGACSWYIFASAVIARAGLARAIEPCATADFPRPAPRPANSRLEKRALRSAGLAPMPGWEETLARFLREHPQG